jgi:hypothetical protein
MAMKPKTNISFKLFFLSFPKEWKELIVKLQLSIDPKFNTMYNLKTNVLYGYLNGWLDDVVQITPMKQDSYDSKWFVSLNEPDAEKICEIIQIWISGEYLQHYKKTDETERIANELMDTIDPEYLRSGISIEETVMFDPEGHALTDYAFNAFSLYAANALNGMTITLGGQELTFSSCGSKMLMSQPVSDGKSKPNYYSIGLQLSLQTTPPERTCMLLIDCSVKRFISNIKEGKENIFLSEDIHAYVATGNSKYRRITLSHLVKKEEGSDKYIHSWYKPEQECYNIYNSVLLPSADDVLYHPEQYLKGSAKPQILLPYKNGMKFTDMYIGTGVSVKDKQEIISQLSKLMKEFADMAEPATPIKQSKAVHNTPSSNTSKSELQRIHCERLKQCTGMSDLRIEIYGHSSDSELSEKLKTEFETYLGGEEYRSVFPVDIVEKELGSLSDMMEDDTFMSHIQRIEEVKKQVPLSDKIVGAIVILPDMRDEAGDPKDALRAGFAETNRITQFITPDGTKKDDSSEHRVKGAVMDMLRQFGYTEFYEKRGMKNNPAFGADTVGMYILHQLKPLWAEKSKLAKDTARFLPVYVTYNVRSGKVSVDSDLLEKRHLSYPEALIAFSKLSRDKDFVQKCVDSSRSGFRTKLLGLQSLYQNDPAIILTQANGITRQLWHGLTDKKIAEYQLKAEYIPEKIEVGTKNYSDMRSFCDTGLRIMRIRENYSTHEVPDYYTEFNDKGDCISASGVYRYKDVFWGLESRPNTKEYTLSYKESKITKPSLNFDECELVEYYPIQLQVNDDVEQWASYANYLREVMPEVNRSVRLPAPLHFASKIEEYLLLVKRR